MTKLIGRWPVVRQLRGHDPHALGEAAQSPRSRALRPRIEEADHVAHSICPFCAVGCGQLVYVRNGEVTQIEGDPASPISRGRLCPKGSASKNLVNASTREQKVKYRRPYGIEWEELSLEEAMNMIADRVVKTRAETWQQSKQTEKGELTLRRSMGIASLGGATLDNEENYLIKKLFTALGLVQ